ncbi:MAG: DNA polymerase III subunit gamma/tau [Lachnospiraceae bacterium]|nr:DNA polymerase III subunit gamma/tau [Lachnospiraceae bacterium]
MSYTALYRKWRPETFSEVKGQDPIVKTLKNQVASSHTAHAYLFNGTRGTGKTSVAKIMAMAVNCENPTDGEPCLKCSTCLSIAKGSNLNIREIDAASNNGVDNIREIKEDVIYKPTSGRYKVYIIDEAHMLSSAAFNALLKTLEEPPEYVIFILATTEISSIPITISSRCQRYDFKRISVETISDQLTELAEKENILIEEKAVRYIARSADGAMRDALSLLDRCVSFSVGEEITYENVLDILGAVDTDTFSEMYNCLKDGNVLASLEVLKNALDDGVVINRFINDLIDYLRNVLLINCSMDENGDVPEELMPDISDANLDRLREDASASDADTVMYFIKELSELSEKIKKSNHKKTLTEVAVIKLCTDKYFRGGDSGGNNEIIKMQSEAIITLEQEMQRLKTQMENLSKVGAADYMSIRSNSVEHGNETKREEISPTVKRDLDSLSKGEITMAQAWDSIMTVYFETYKQSIPAHYRKSGKFVSYSDDRHEITYVIKSKVYFDKLKSLDENTGKTYLELLRETISELTGMENITIELSEERNSNKFNNYTDISELVKADIEIDDREENV